MLKDTCHKLFLTVDRLTAPISEMKMHCNSTIDCMLLWVDSWHLDSSDFSLANVIVKLKLRCESEFPFQFSLWKVNFHFNFHFEKWIIVLKSEFSFQFSKNEFSFQFSFLKWNFTFWPSWATVPHFIIVSTYNYDCWYVSSLEHKVRGVPAPQTGMEKNTMAPAQRVVWIVVFLCEFQPIGRQHFK